MDERKPPVEDSEEHEADRRRNNIALLVVFALVVGAGLWLVNALVEHKKLDDCLAQGRRNCVPIEVPPPPR
jgi:hypothetical protein